jgi:hypothetical protein
MRQFIMTISPGKRIGRQLAIATAGLLAAATWGAGSVSAQAQPAQAAQTVTQPMYVYMLGPQGYGYYYVAPQVQTTPVAQPAPATQPAPVRQSQTAPPAQTIVPSRAANPTQYSTGQRVGPGIRNWATGNRVPLHRPWLNARH